MRAAPHLLDFNDLVMLRPARPMARTCIDFHLGDNLIHLHFLRGLAAANPGIDFVHAAHECHLAQMLPMVADVPNVSLLSIPDALRSLGATWLNAWKNAGGYFDRHPGRLDFCEFHLDWFAHLARQMGLQSPFTRAEDLLFDYPALLAASDRFPFPGEFDFLVINSRPCSAQWLAYDSLEYLDPLLADLVAAGYTVVVTQPTKVQAMAGGAKGRIVCTQDYGMSVTDIGRISHRCRHHLMVSTGPSWPVMNKWNLPSENLRLLFIENERVNYPSVVHVSTRERCREILVEKSLL